MGGPPQVSKQASELASGISMHAAGLRPLYLDWSSVPEEALKRERQLLTEQAARSGKSEAMVAKVQSDFNGV